MKKLLAIAIILFVAINLASINVTFAKHTATVAWAKEPPVDPTYPPHPGAANEYYWNGNTSKWINFTVRNDGPDPIKEIKIVFKKDSDGNSYFNFSQTRQNKTGWYATPDEFGPNKRPTVLYFRTDNTQYYIQVGETARFDLYMTEGPKDECSYNIDVWTVDAGGQISIDPSTNLYQLFILIDKKSPAVQIIYPSNGDIFKNQTIVWVNATANDSEGLHPSRIKKVELWFTYTEKNGTSNPTLIDIMKYDSVKNVYWWNDQAKGDKLRNEANHTATAFAYDYADNNKAESNSITFFWFDPKPPLRIKNIEPCFLQDQQVGHVGSNVTIEAPTGFKPNSNVTVHFGTILVGSNITNWLGNFTLTFPVPETRRNASVTDPSKTLPYTVKVTDGIITNTTTFTVIPWIEIDKTEGFVGNLVTIRGKGFSSNVDVDIIYRDVGFGTAYWDWAVEWNETTKFMWKPNLGNLTLNKVRTNANGTCLLTFNVPESYGGWHTIFGREVTSGVRSGWMPSVTPPPPEPYPQAAFFKVKTKVWTERTVGLSGQYLTIKALGLPLPEYSNKTYDCKTRTTTIEEHNWTLALDFGPDKYWVFEKGFILNNELDYAWASKLYLPFAYYFNHTDLTSPIWNGTLCWRDVQGEYHEGSQFLKVPALVPGTYEISIYQFNMQTHEDATQYEATTSFMVIKDPLYVRVNTGAFYFSGENVTVYAEIDLDGTATDPTEISMELYHENTFVDSLTAKRVDTGLFTALFTCPSEKGNYFIKVNATKTIEDVTLIGFDACGFVVSPTLDGLNATIIAMGNDIATIKTDIGNIILNLTDINAKITNIEGNIVTIETDIGQIKTDVSSINGKLVQIETIGTTLSDVNGKVISIGTNVATIQTDVETIKTTFSNINAQISAIGVNTVEIKTAVGDIQGKVTSILQEKTVEIQTGIGNISTKLDSIKTETVLQPISLALSLVAALSAIIAAMMIFRKLYK